MKRREFIAGLGGVAAAWSGLALAQGRAPPLIGYLHIQTPELAPGGLVPFRAGLRETGFVEGRDVAIEYRFASFNSDRLPALAADLVSRQVSVIVTGGGDQTALAAKAVTTAIPLVFVGAGNPIETGLVASFNRPGGNITGVSLDINELMAKRVELLHQLAPGARTIVLLVRPSAQGGSGSAETNETATKAAAQSLGLQLYVATASDEHKIDDVFATVARKGTAAILVGNDVFFANRRDQIAALANRYQIPTSGYRRELTEAGALMSYGPSVPDGYRQAGVYTGRILKGDKPADLPVLAPTKFDLVINLKTAKALGLTIPETLLATADEVIQ
jgi:putative tryptophan/tyrosine transport system substrate-binding protein